MCKHQWQSKLSDLSGRKGAADLESNGENWQEGTPLTRTGYISNSQFGSLNPLGVNSIHVDIDHRTYATRLMSVCLSLHSAQLCIYTEWEIKQKEMNRTELDAHAHTCLIAELRLLIVQLNAMHWDNCTFIHKQIAYMLMQSIYSHTSYMQ